MALDKIGIKKTGKTQSLPSVYQELINIFEDVVGDLRKSAEDKGLDASGNLIASIVFKPQILGANQFRFSLNLADYYKYVDEGRLPGKYPPLKPILEWMRYKGIVPRDSEGKRLKTNEKTLKALAYRISRGISKKGTIKRFGYKGSNFYSDVIPDETQFVKGIIKRIATAAKKDILVEIKTYNA